MALKLRLVVPEAVEEFASSKEGKLKELLSPLELLAFYSLKSQKRRRDWLAGRLAAKELLAFHLQSLGCPLPLWQIELYGGPCFRLLGPQTKSQKLNISIAHSHGYGLCGLAQTLEDGYIGVDLERIRPINNKLQRRFLTRHEMEQIKRLSLKKEGAVLFWALKEAAFKALHASGLPLKALQVKITEVSKVSGGKAVITYKRPEGPLAISAAYLRHADFFLAWATVPEA